NAVHCADYLLAQFIEKFKSSPYSKDTVLVIASDHLMMMSDANLDANDKTRENLWLAYNTGLDAQIIKRDSTTFDIMPTFLTLIGFDANDFILGRNIFKSEPTLYEKYGEDTFF